MAKPDVRMNYGSMETMASQFKDAANAVESSTAEMMKIAQMMEGGALLGMGGDQFQDAIKSQLVPNMKKLSQKLVELNKDINNAVKFTRDGVAKSKNRFTPGN